MDTGGEIHLEISKVKGELGDVVKEGVFNGKELSSKTTCLDM